MNIIGNGIFFIVKGNIAAADIPRHTIDCIYGGDTIKLTFSVNEGAMKDEIISLTNIIQERENGTIIYEESVDIHLVSDLLDGTSIGRSVFQLKKLHKYPNLILMVNTEKIDKDHYEIVYQLNEKT